jgi:tRNA threonylcarbamoyladenosine biosynthesis protein TsaE
MNDARQTAGPQQMVDPLRTTGPEQTEALGAELAAVLAPGDVVLVEGELGAGKTTFVRGAARALGVEGVVTSPTFTIGQLYPAEVPVAHVDLFRVASLDDEDPEFLADYVRSDTIAFIEWASHGEQGVAALGRIAARVTIAHAGADTRTVTIAHAGGGRRNAAAVGGRRNVAAGASGTDRR